MFNLRTKLLINEIIFFNILISKHIIYIPCLSKLSYSTFLYKVDYGYIL